MFDRKRGGAFQGWLNGPQGPSRLARRPALEPLEGRQLLAATIGPLGPLSVPATVGFQLPLNGGAGGAQTYTVSSSNADVKATVANGKFLTIGVSHSSSGATDPAFAGSLTFQLFDDLTPLTTSKIEQLVTQGFYDSATDPSASKATTPPSQFPSKNFFRIVPDFVIQGGSRSGDNTGSSGVPGFPFDDEYNQQLVYNGTGQLAMANAGNDTNDSQIFVTLGSPRNLDFNKTIFGQLVAGQDTLDKIAGVARQPANSTNSEGSTPVTPILFTSTTLSDTNPNGVIHLDATRATAGEVSNLTITATETATGMTSTVTVPVTVSANVDAQGKPINEQPFLNPIVNPTVGLDQTAVFKLDAVDAQATDTLTYIVGGAPPAGQGPSLPLPTVQSATATVDANGVVRVTPTKGFTGVVQLLVGVRNQVDHSGTGTLETITNYDTQRINVNVTNGQVVNLPPIASSGSTNVLMNNPAAVQLQGDTANPGSPTQTLVYNIVSPPAHGTISNFDTQTGAFVYTPAAGYLGTDSLGFQVTDVGDPTPNLTSSIATETFNVSTGSTGAVRLIDRVLVVTPLPRTDGGTNLITVSQVNGKIQVQVNGVIDQIQPAPGDLDKIVVYGSKAGDHITVAPQVDVPTTLNGGQGGKNVIIAGGGSSRMHGWSGRNVLQGGAEFDVLIGRAGHVRFRQSAGNDVYFAGIPRRRGTLHGIDFPGVTVRASARDAKGQPPRGTYYRFVNDRLVVSTHPPRFPVAPMHAVIPGRVNNHPGPFQGAGS
ncbi:MAG: peptidylprolyl isomerase [Isosphaeraceae bacterium]